MMIYHPSNIPIVIDISLTKSPNYLLSLSKELKSLKEIRRTTIHQKLFPLLFYTQIASLVISTVSKNLFNVSITQAKSFAFIQPEGETVPKGLCRGTKSESIEEISNSRRQPIAKTGPPLVSTAIGSCPRKMSRSVNNSLGSNRRSRRNSNGYCLMAGEGKFAETLSPSLCRFHGLNYRVFEDKTLSNLTVGTWQIIKDGKYIYDCCTSSSINI